MLMQCTRGQCGIRSKWLKQSLKITVFPSSLLTATPATVKPHSVSSAAFSLHSLSRFPIIRTDFPVSHHSHIPVAEHQPCCFLLILLHLHFCLLISCSSCYMSWQQDLSFKAILFPFLPHFSTSDQKQNSHGASQHAWALADSGASGLTLFCGYPHVCNASKVPGCHSLPLSEKYSQGKSLHENTCGRRAVT